MSEFPPGPPNSRQEIIKFARDPLAYFLDLTATYGEFVFARIATRDTYVITSPDALRVVLVDKAEQFGKTGHTRDAASTFLGDGMLTSEGAIHRRHRRTVQPVFTRAWVEGYAQAMVDSTTALLTQWRDGEVRDIAADMMQLALNIVGRTVFGVDSVAQNAALTAVTAVIQQYTSDTLTRGKLIHVSEEQCQAAVATLDRLVSDVLAKHHSDGERDLITLMRSAADPETGEHMTEKEIRDEALTLLMAGHETTANALAWTVYLLAKHPEAQSAVRREIAGVCGGQRPTVEDLHRMEYLDRVLKESLRLYPPAWLLGRTPYEPVDVCGYVIAPEANIVISPYVIHRNPRYFPEPERFDPDRFLVEPVRYTYLPFGAGPRVCIGQPFAMLEMALVLITALQRYRFVLENGHVAQPEPMMTLRPKGGLPIRMQEIRNE